MRDALFLVVVSTLGCARVGEPFEAKTDAFASSDGSAHADDAVAPDTSRPDVSVADGCIPGCHWDCFSESPFCTADRIWSGGYGPRPCCRHDDPPPSPGGWCARGLLHACTAGCTSIDKRYAVCLAGSSEFDVEVPEHIYLMLCAENAPRTAGALCKTNEDCRPAVEGETLRCDFATGRCVPTPRPPKPSGYGVACAFEAKASLGVGREDIVLTPTCPRCYVARDTTCLRSHCTIECKLDEDCPSGSICACHTWPYPFQVCVPTNDRTLAARIASISCATAPDAGPDTPPDAPTTD